MVTAVAFTPFSVTLPLTAPVPSFTVRLAVPVAFEFGAGKICAPESATANAGLLSTLTVIAVEVADWVWLSVTLAVSVWLPSAAPVVFQDKV